MKVTKEKISSEFINKASSKQSDMSEEERQAQGIFNSVREEASKDVAAVKALLSTNTKTGDDFDGTLIEASNFISRDEQIAQ